MQGRNRKFGLEVGEIDQAYINRRAEALSKPGSYSHEALRELFYLVLYAKTRDDLVLKPLYDAVKENIEGALGIASSMRREADEIEQMARYLVSEAGIETGKTDEEFDEAIKYRSNGIRSPDAEQVGEEEPEDYEERNEVTQSVEDTNLESVDSYEYDDEFLSFATLCRRAAGNKFVEITKETVKNRAVKEGIPHDRGKGHRPRYVTPKNRLFSTMTSLLRLAKRTSIWYDVCNIVKRANVPINTGPSLLDRIVKRLEAGDGDHLNIVDRGKGEHPRYVWRRISKRQEGLKRILQLAKENWPRGRKKDTNNEDTGDVDTVSEDYDFTTIDSYDFSSVSEEEITFRHDVLARTLGIQPDKLQEYVDEVVPEDDIDQEDDVYKIDFDTAKQAYLRFTYGELGRVVDLKEKMDGIGFVHLDSVGPSVQNKTGKEHQFNDVFKAARRKELKIVGTDEHGKPVMVEEDAKSLFNILYKADTGRLPTFKEDEEELVKSA